MVTFTPGPVAVDGTSLVSNAGILSVGAITSANIAAGAILSTDLEDAARRRFLVWSSGVISANGTAHYVSPAGAVWSSTSSDSESEDAKARFIVPRAGKLLGFLAQAGIAAASSTYTVKVRVNGSAVITLTFTNPGAFSQQTDNATSVTVAAGDYVTIEFVRTAGTTNNQFTGVLTYIPD